MHQMPMQMDGSCLVIQCQPGRCAYLGTVDALASLPLGSPSHSHPVPAGEHGECHLELPQKVTSPLQPRRSSCGPRGPLPGLINKRGASHRERPSPHLGLHRGPATAAFCLLPRSPIHWCSHDPPELTLVNTTGKINCEEINSGGKTHCFV